MPKSARSVFKPAKDAGTFSEGNITAGNFEDFVTRKNINSKEGQISELNIFEPSIENGAINVGYDPEKQSAIWVYLEDVDAEDFYGLRFQIRPTPPSSGNKYYYGLYGSSEMGATATNKANRLRGASFFTGNNNLDVDYMWGLHVESKYFGLFDGTVISNYGIEIEQNNANVGGNLTNAYGLYIGNIEEATNNWAIYTEAGEISFGDDVNIRTGNIKINSTTIIDSSGYIKPISSTDTSAPNNSIYFSTTQNKLVYKDSSGNINNLY